MYCVNCGVKLADTEKLCPLCGTAAFHPEIDRKLELPLYPQQRYPAQKVNSRVVQVVLTTAFLLPIFITLLCDMQINRTVTWSGYVIGALLLGYIILVLPLWFRKPNPVIFVPCDFAAAALYLLYINFAVGGNWFLSFALPVTGGTAVIITAMVVLLRYLRRGRLFIIGGGLIATGLFMPLIEFLLHLTFHPSIFFGWSFYPLVLLLLLGAMLLFLAIHRPTREMMERKFFI